MIYEVHIYRNPQDHSETTEIPLTKVQADRFYPGWEAIPESRDLHDAPTYKEFKAEERAAKRALKKALQSP